MDININRNVKLFMEGYGKNGGRRPEERYSSFDYCFNYFQSFKDARKYFEISSPENIQLSCLHLGFYLASWGMYRGSSFLLEKSSKYLVCLIKNISKSDDRIWGVDVDAYTDENIRILLECRKMIAGSFRKNVVKLGRQTMLLRKTTGCGKSKT